MSMPVVVAVSDVNTLICIMLAVSLLFAIVRIVIQRICCHQFLCNNERSLCVCMWIVSMFVHFYKFTSGWLVFSLSSASLITTMLAWSWKSAKTIFIVTSAVILVLTPITCSYILTVTEAPAENKTLYTSSFDWQVIKDARRFDVSNEYAEVFIYHDHVNYEYSTNRIESKGDKSTSSFLSQLEIEKNKKYLDKKISLTKIMSSGTSTTLNIQALKHEYQQIVLTAPNAMIVNSSLHCSSTLFLERYKEEINSTYTNYSISINNEQNVHHVPCLVLPFDVTMRNCTIKIDVMPTTVTTNYSFIVSDKNTTKDANSDEIDDRYNNSNSNRQFVLHVELLHSCDDLSRLICEATQWEYIHQDEEYKDSRLEKQDVKTINCGNVVECISPTVSKNYYYLHSIDNNNHYYHHHHHHENQNHIEPLSHELHSTNDINSEITEYNAHSSTLYSFPFSSEFVENAPFTFIIKQYINSLIETTWKPYLWQVTNFAKENLINAISIKSTSADIVEYTSSHLRNWARCCVWFTKGALLDLSDHLIASEEHNEIMQQRQFEQLEQLEEEEDNYREQCLRRGANTASTCAQLLQFLFIYLVQLGEMLLLVIKHAILYNTKVLQYVIITIRDLAHKISMSEVYRIVMSYACRVYNYIAGFAWSYLLWSYKLLQLICAYIPVLIKYLLGTLTSIVKFCYVTLYELWLLYRETSMVTQALITIAQTIIAVTVLRTKFVLQHELLEHSKKEQHSSTGCKKLPDKHTKRSLPAQNNLIWSECVWNWFSPVWSWMGLKEMWYTCARWRRMPSFVDSTWITIEFLFSHHKTIVRYVTEHIILTLILFGLYVLPFTNIAYRFTSLFIYPWISSYHALIVWNVSMSNNCKSKPLYWQVSLVMLMRVMMCILLEITAITLLHKLLYDVAVWAGLFIIVIVIVFKHDQLKRSELLKRSTNIDSDGNRDVNHVRESNDDGTYKKSKKANK